MGYLLLLFIIMKGKIEYNQFLVNKLVQHYHRIILANMQQYV